MNAELVNFASRIGRMISRQDGAFNDLALELFGLQFKNNAAYRRICEAKGLTSENARHWTEVPFVPTAAFKELDLSCISIVDRTAVFHSSGTTEQKPSRHFHCPNSLELYEMSLWAGFVENVLASFGSPSGTRLEAALTGMQDVCPTQYDLVVLTPPPRLAPHSSLIHMFETVRRNLAAPETVFLAELDRDGGWAINFDAALAALRTGNKPKLIVGTAFSFVHLLDFLAERNVRLQLPASSRVMETGGYKNRSRAMPKPELHALITGFLGIPRRNIICEYGMSELSSQAYDFGHPERCFQFPSWARVQIVSPETGLEVDDGETGLIRVLDLANVFSVAAIQTEDLAVRRGDGFELKGRAVLAEARGCSLMTA